jgi:hypothetical protein
MGSGFIVASNQPESINRYTWLKPLANGGFELYEPIDGGWEKVLTIPSYALKNHTHETFENLELKGTLSINGDKGVNKTVKVGDLELTFSQGVLTKLK